MKLLSAFLLLGAVLVTAIIGCGPAAGPDAGPETRHIVRGNGGEPGTLDPALAEDVHAFNVLIDLYEGLVTEDAAGRRVPGVAESWTMSDDRLIYTFHLRDGLHWSNGDALTAEDFVRALRRVAAPETASTYAFLLRDIENFDEVVTGRSSPAVLGVAALSSRVLEIRLSTSSDTLLAVLTQPATFPVHASGDTAIGNGAFELAAREADGSIRLRKNPFYHAADTVLIDQVTYLPIVDPVSEFNAYRAGEIDITSTIPAQRFPYIREQLASEIYVAPMLALYYIAFDLSEPPFDQRALRQALTMAIDRRELTKLIGRGEQPACGIVPPGVDGHRNELYDWCGNPPDQVRDAARALYEQAGFNAAFPLEIRYVYDAGDPLHERVALAVSAMWRDILGVRTTLEKREWMYFLDTRERRNEWDVMRFAWFGDYNGARTFLDIFRSDSEQNLAAYSNDAYDEILSDPQMNTAAAEAVLLSDHPVAPLYFFVGKHLVKPHVHGFENNVMDRHPSRYLGINADVKRR